MAAATSSKGPGDSGSMERSTPVAVGVRELKNQLSSYLERVKAGEEITVTEHGRPIARLISLGGDLDSMASLVALGVVQPAVRTHRRLPKKRVRLQDGSTSIAEIVADQRR
jgi:prevent-host-death family protein